MRDTLSANESAPITRREILWLRLDAPPADLYSGFIGESELLGYSISTIDSKGFSTARAAEQIRNAAGYILTHRDIIGDPHLSEVLRAEVQRGKRILVYNPPDPELNAWLIEYDMAVTKKKFWATNPRPLTAIDGRTVILEIESQENELATSLMRGNHELEIDSPRPVWYGKRATPVLIASDDMKVIDRRDYFEDLDIRKQAYAAAWPVGDAKAHRVLLLGGFYLDNPLMAGGKQVNAGLPANRRFAKNLLRWLVGDLEVGSDPKGKALQQIHGIEVSMLDIIKGTLQKEYSDQWWYELPLDIRQAAAELHEQRRGKVPKECCLHFIQLKTIIEKKWRIFEPIMGHKSSKKELMDRLQLLNDLRNRLSHPTGLIHEPLSNEDFALIDKEFVFFSAIAEKTPPSSPV